MVYKSYDINTLKFDLNTPKLSRLRSVTAQLIACMCPNLLLLDLGLAVSFSTISVPELLNSQQGLSLDDAQASWFGSLPFLTQPLGALISGPLVDYLGRKKANFFVNIPHLIAWTILYFAWNVPSLFVGSGLLGLGTGIMEAPINSYVGEISEPSLRGALCTMIQVFSCIGTLLMYFLGTVVNWRIAAIISLAVPISSMILILFVPETPVWLLSRAREEEALKSLQFLRGWTTAGNVKEEFDDLVIYTKTLGQCVICNVTDDKSEQCIHKQMNLFKRTILNFKYVMFCKETLRPLTLVILYFVFYTMSGIIPVQANMENVCKAFGMSDDGKQIVLIVGIIQFVASMIMIWIVKTTGKRKLGITCMLLTGASAASISAYAKKYLSDEVFSYNTATFPTETSKIPLIMFYALTTFNVALPWVILGEVLPFRSRASAQGIAAATHYFMIFVASKTLIDLETSVHLWGTFAVYASFGFLGTIYLYFYLPETEGRSLQDIEALYSGKHRIFADDPFINVFKKNKKNQNN